MDAFTQLFEHKPLLRAIICRNCALAIPPAQISTHLKEHHTKVRPRERDSIAAAARELRDLAWDPSDLTLPKQAERSIPGLVDIANAFVCQPHKCGYTCLSKQGIASHCKRTHGWINIQARGGDARKKSKEPSNRLWAEKQPCQRVFKAAGWPAYIAVKTRVNERPMCEAVAGLEAECQRLRAERGLTAAQQTIKESRRQHANPWLELNGWLSHLKGQEPEALLRARLPPSKEDSVSGKAERDLALEDVCKAMRRLTVKAFGSCRPEVIGRPALELIERRETGAPSNEKPFYAQHKARTVKRYTEKLVSVFCYLWRTHGHESKRPPYRFTERQGSSMLRIKRLADAEPTPSKAEFEAECLYFWIALLHDALPDDEYASPLLSGVAVLGLKPAHLGGGWYPAHEFSPTMSALITTSKALVLHYARCKRDEARQTDPNTTMSVYELVKTMSEEFMRLSDYTSVATPMNRMLRLRTLARSLGNQRNTPGLVSWDGDKILVDRQSFTVADLQSMVKGLYESTRHQLLRDVLLLDLDDNGCICRGTTALPTLCMDKLVDQPGELAAGFSFLEHPANKLTSWKEWLWDRLMQEPGLQRRFLLADSEPVRLRDSAVAAYMRGVRKFREALFALVHFSGGAPARGTEITSIQWQNDAEGMGSRGVFVEGGLIAFTTTYHKGYSFSKRVKTIHRYVPREVSELVVYFLGLGHPFVDLLQMMHYRVPEASAFIWEPAPEEELDVESNSDEGGEGDESDRSDGSDGEDTILRSATGTGKKRSANPDGFWGTDRIRRVLREHTSRYMDATLGTRAWRHSYPAIHRELARDSEARGTVEMLYYDSLPVADDARALQSGHTLATEEMAYGRSLLESPWQTHSERLQFRRVSIDWHRVLAFASACREGPESVAITAQQQEFASQRWLALSRVDVKETFRQLLGQPNAEFRSKQEEGLRAVVQRRLRVLAVMATGAGKSMLFMLPASVSKGGVTVVIAPLNALRDNMLDRCDKLGIASAKWDGRRPPYWASIVLVTPESAVSPAFGRFMDEKRALRQLDRIVVDECHILLEASKTWRPDVLKLDEMTGKGTQVVYLTATLPPTLQSAFLQVAGLDERTLTVCRDERTSRPNISYMVVDYPREQPVEKTVAELVAQKRQHFGPDAQIIVYCPTKEMTKRLAVRLGCIAYYREMGSEEDKERLVRSFTAGAEKLCTATNMLGLGLDAPGVRVVIHVAMCRLLLEYIQESGRAGRAGQPSESIVLRASWRNKMGKITRAVPSKLEPPALEFLTSETCRRIGIDRHMDGREDRQQCEVGEAKCDLCTKPPRGTKRPISVAALDEGDAAVAASEESAMRRALGKEVEREQRQNDLFRRRAAEEATRELERLEGHLARWNGVCTICMATRAERLEHEYQDCPFAEHHQKSAVKFRVQFLQAVRWQPFARCSHCWVPQAICNRWVETDQHGAFQERPHMSCQYESVLRRAVAALLALQFQTCGPWLRQQAALAALQEPRQEERLRRVLGLKAKMGQQDASIMAYFLHAWEEGVVQKCAAEARR